MIIAECSPENMQVRTDEKHVQGAKMGQGDNEITVTDLVGEVKVYKRLSDKQMVKDAFRICKANCDKYKGSHRMETGRQIKCR